MKTFDATKTKACIFYYLDEKKIRKATHIKGDEK